MVLGKPSSVVSKQTQEHISTAHCLMDAPAAGSWDIRFISLRNRHLWDERKQMDVTDSTLKVFLAEAREIVPKNEWRLVDVLRAVKT